MGHREEAVTAAAPGVVDAEWAGVSVVIPFYNRSRFADRLFRSIIAQTVKPVAVFIVDNGSTPEELAACRRIASGLDWSGIAPKFLQTARSGNANYARNLGMDAARTRYVAFVDSDDWWDPLHLERSLARLSGSGRAGVYAGAIVHEAVVRVDRSRDVEACGAFELLFSGCSAQTSSYVIDMEKVASLRWDESLKRHQDFDFFLQVHHATSGWAFLETPTTHVDWREGGAGNAADVRSMVRFRRKWRSRIPAGSVAPYAYLQLLQSYEHGRHPMYKRYYRRLFLAAAGGGPTARMRSLGCYVALKGLLHRHGLVRWIDSARRRSVGA